MTKKKLKVIGVSWHVAHQYELAKLSFIDEYHVIANPWKRWNIRSRPVPEKMKVVPSYTPGEYDLAILHVDQQSLYREDGSDRVAKGRLYVELDQLIQDIPKVVINHMTPFHDRHETHEVIEMIREVVGDNHMVVNSYMAAEQWGWGHPIIHGMEVDEWWDLPKEPRVTIVLSPQGMDKAYRRIFPSTVMRLAKEVGLKIEWVGSNIPNRTSFDDYRDYLGRSLVFFNPTWQSPRPRARTEAMLSGCCVVTTPYHDASTFIEDGVNGFLTSRMADHPSRVMDNPQKSLQILLDLIEHPRKAMEVGQRGKQTARELFNLERFEDQWREFLTEEVGVL